MKTIYLTYVFHGNMDYDRYGKAVIRRAFPEIYRMVADEFLKYPQLRAQVELSGVTFESLRLWAPDVIDTLQELRRRGQVVFSGSDYAAPVNVCVDGETGLASILLGCDVVRGIAGDIDGFFAQEESYHPQLPALLRRAGVEWVTVTPELQFKNPFRLMGLDGTSITGVPLTSIDAGNIEEYFDKAEPDSLLCSVGDYEMPPSFEALLERIGDMAARGKKVEFTFVRDYLARFGARGEACYPVCAIFPENTASSPSFSRWTSDPLDIRVHAETVKAAKALQTATLIDAGIWAITGGKADGNLKDARVSLSMEPRAWAIENPDEFSELEARHFPQPISILDKARHLLLWAVNSDARGWYPMPEKRYERINSLRNCSGLAGEVSIRGLKTAEALLERASESGGCQGYGSLTVCNPDPSRTELLEVCGPAPMGAPAVSVFDGTAYRSRFLLSVPSYSIEAVPLKSETQCPDAPKWRPGNTAANDELTLAATDDGALVLSGPGLNGSDLRLSLRMPEVREFGKAPSPVSRAFSSPAFSYVRSFCVPELMIYKQMDWCIHLTQTYRLVADYVLCDWEFHFTKPLLIGPGASGQFDPEGIRAVLTHGAAAATGSGEVWYDSPFAVPKHGSKSAGYLTAYTFALLQSIAGGAAIVSTSGVQSFWADAEAGELGLCMGASTVGSPAGPTDMTVNREQHAWEHFDTWDREVFFGRYKQSFALKPFASGWKESGIHDWALARTAPLVYGISDKALQGNLSILKLEGDGVRLTSLTVREGVLTARLAELFGRETTATLQVGEHRATRTMGPFAIEDIELR